MKKIWTYLLTVALFLSVIFASACTQKYQLTVDISKANGVEFLEELPKTCHPGTSLTVKTPIYTDIDLWAYLDGQSRGKQRPIKTDGEYSHWEFTFTMPEKDSTLSFEWKMSDNAHVCYHVCLEEKAATCQQEGWIVIGCTDCGEEYERTVLPILPCQFDESGKCIWCGVSKGVGEE